MGLAFHKMSLSSYWRLTLYIAEVLRVVNTIKRGDD